MGEKGNDSVHQVTNVGTWGDGHRSFLLAERAPSECARSMRAVRAAPICRRVVSIEVVGAGPLSYRYVLHSQASGETHAS